MFEGYKECLDLLDSGKIKKGRILAMVRSFEHHSHREGDKQMHEDNLLDDAIRLLARPVITKRAKKKLEKMGQPERCG